MNNILKKMAAILAVIFILSNLSVAVGAPAVQQLDEDYRDKIIFNTYGNKVAKPTAQFMAIRERNGDVLSTATSYDGMDFNAEFPTLECYVGDTLRLEDLSRDSMGGSIVCWDWQRFGHLGDKYKEYNYNIVNQDSYTLDTPGETTFFLCVKSNVRVKTGSLDPWSDNGNHQTVGKNKWFPRGMYWYFTAIRVVVHPTMEAKVNVRYWDAWNNRIFHEGYINLGELQGDNATVDTTFHITDWDGYEYQKWNVQLIDGSIQYDGTERDVGITLASWLPQKNLNIEYYPYLDTEVKVRYWDSASNRIMYEESMFGDKVVGENETSLSVSIPDWEDYIYTGWNVQLPDGSIQYDGTDRAVNIILNGYIPMKYLNIEYIPKDDSVTYIPDVSNPTPATPADPTPGKPDGICDNEITWTETDSHEVFTGYNSRGRAVYRTCEHTFKYKAVLSAIATVTPNTLKSGYGFETEIACSIETSLVSNTGCSSWGNNRKPTVKIKNPTKATAYIPWTMTNRLGTQPQAISMDNYETLKFRLPVSPVSEAGTRKIYTDITLAGTEENPETHEFEIYINGGGVGKIEFCKKLINNITINGDMYSDDFSGSD